MNLDEAKLVVAQIGSVPGLRAGIVGERIVFEGGRFGPHSLDVFVSSPERVRAHWAGYIPQPARIRVGSKVTFDRGTKVPPVGRVLKLYKSRGTFRHHGGTPMAIVRFAMVNGRYTTYRLPASALTVVPETQL